MIAGGRSAPGHCIGPRCFIGSSQDVAAHAVLINIVSHGILTIKRLYPRKLRKKRLAIYAADVCMERLSSV